MTKLISIVVAALFAAVSVSAVAQGKDEKKKSGDKVIKKDGKMVGGTKDTKKKADKK